jgi:hypothetical protein
MINYKLRKFLIGLSTSLSIVIAILIIYNIIFLRESPLPDDSKVSEGPAYQLTAQVLGEDEAIGMYGLSSGEVKFYQKSNGQIMQIDENGENKIVIDDFEISGLQEAFWNDSGTTSTTKRDGKFSVFNHQTKTPYTFPDKVTNVIFYNPNSLIYTFNDGANIDLSTIDADGANRKRLVSLRTDQIRLHALPNKDRITYTLLPSAYRASTLNSISVNTLVVEPILSDKFGLDVVWSPDGNFGVVTYTTERGGGRMELALIDTEGKVLKTYDLSTVSEKIVWNRDSKYFYVLVPEIARDRVMPDDYYENKINKFTERLYMVKINSDAPQLLSENVGSVDSTDLILNMDETKLFFINRFDNLMYRLPLQ